MSLRVSELRLLREGRDYPALLGRLASGTIEVNARDALLDVLEPDLSAVPDLEQRFLHLLEQGELGAAEALRGELGRDGAPLLSTKARLHQDLEVLLRQVRGRLLILRESNPQAVQDMGRQVEALATDAYLRDYRPGPLLDRLRRTDEQLDRLIEQARVDVRRDIELLRAEPRSAEDRDVALALQRLDQLPTTQESLPTAQRLYLLARRARDGQLSRDDLRLLHQQGGAGGRLVRPRSEFQAIKQVSEAIQLIERGSALRFPSNAEREQTQRLFTALLQTTSTGGLNTSTVAQHLGKFIGFRYDETPTLWSQFGTAFRLRIPSPRIPAFRDTSYVRGIQLLIPVVEGRIQDLLREVPSESLRIVLIAGHQEGGLRSPYRADDLTYLDLVDLLRLGECPLDQRLHAWQQVLLPRLPPRRLKPYQSGGPVSPEMFRGRREIIEELSRPKGGTVLFSGRMMGKSSILTKIHGDLEARHHLGGAASETSVFLSCASDDLLTPLCDKLAMLLGGTEGQRHRTTDRQNMAQTTLTPADRRSRMRKRLANLRELITALLQRFARLTILIDEADKFAAADAERAREESLAWLLRDLEFEQPERLRVIFAGFQTIHHEVLFHSGAFANWFGLKELGPLEQPDAEALVREPFADFGFVFSSQAAVDRLLDFTGRHPLLLQEVCSRLMDRVESRRGPLGGEEVVLIQAGDVETVCRDDQLRDRLRQVLSLNLDDYPRLKLMVYLLLFATSTPGRSLILEKFRLEDLTEILVEFYEDRFNDYFNRQSLSALLQELVALGLVAPRGNSYEFVNRTFAAMLREDRTFDGELERLLELATNPERAESRRFFTLSAEDQERLMRTGRGCSIVVGLPQSMRSFIAQRLYQQQDGGRESSAYTLDAAGCTSLESLRDRFKAAVKETRKLVSIGDLLVKQSIRTLLLDGVDELAAGEGLASLIEQIAQREVRLIMLGGAPLARRYVSELLAHPDVDVVSLRRLRPKDIKDWGERSGIGGECDEFQIIFDRQTSERLAHATGGHMGLLHPFRQFIRGRKRGASECVPDLKDISDYARERITRDTIEQLLSPLLPPERLLLDRLHAFANKERMWEIEWEFVEEEVLAPLCRSEGSVYADWLDRLELLRLLDLLEDRPVSERRRILLDSHSPMAGPR